MKRKYKEEPHSTGITPLVKSLTDAVKLPEDFNLKEEYTDYLIEKHN